MPGARRRKLGRLKKRSEFLRVAGKGRRSATAGLVLQAFDRAGMSPTDDIGEAEIRVGFTASRKVGSAVARNRARRRLREVAAAVLPTEGRHGTDYVIIARAATVKRPFGLLVSDLRSALARLDGAVGPRRRRRRKDRRGDGGVGKIEE